MPPERGDTPPCMPERGVTAPVVTSKIQLWARPRYPQLVKRLASRFTPAPASAPRSASLPFAGCALRKRQACWLRQGQSRGRRERVIVGAGLCNPITITNDYKA
eukprot:5289626-Pleurochrysis_carterae.AAC.1